MAEDWKFGRSHFKCYANPTVTPDAIIPLSIKDSGGLITKYILKNPCLGIIDQNYTPHEISMEFEIDNIP